MDTKRYYVEVECKECKKHYLKKKYAIKDWNGLCTHCNSVMLAQKMGKKYGKLYSSNLSKDGFHGKHTEATKQKMREKAIGRNAGSKHYLWKGDGARPRTIRNRAMIGAEYRNWRKAVFERDDYTCQICGQRGGKLHADHIVEWQEDPEKRYDLDNGRTLCVACHYKVTFGKDMPEGSDWGKCSTINIK